MEIKQAMTDYLLNRDLSQVKRFKLHVGAFSEYWPQLQVEDIKGRHVNEFLDTLGGRGLSAPTVNTYRKNLIAFWRFCWDSEYIDSPPRGINKPRKIRRRVECWSGEEIKAIRRAAEQLPRSYMYKVPGRGGRVRVPRSIWWRGLITAGLDTGLRPSDLMRLPPSCIKPDGSFVIMEEKTGKLAHRKFSVAAMADINYIRNAFDGENEHLFPVSVDRSHLCVTFSGLIESSGVGRGSMKWLRRTAATMVESRAEGEGTALCNHTKRETTLAHYIDQEKAAPKLIEGPSIEWDS